jgi:hypothetical protein
MEYILQSRDRLSKRFVTVSCRKYELRSHYEDTNVLRLGWNFYRISFQGYYLRKIKYKFISKFISFLSCLVKVSVTETLTYFTLTGPYYVLKGKIRNCNITTYFFKVVYLRIVIFWFNSSEDNS